ncbi:MAG: hypothetical protein QOD99_1369 [Chthoniobacter sp.]|nr:hypothetical protein [Chthoniobacter sp.]
MLLFVMGLICLFFGVLIGSAGLANIFSQTAIGVVLLVIGALVCFYGLLVDNRVRRQGKKEE